MSIKSVNERNAIAAKYDEELAGQKKAFEEAIAKLTRGKYPAGSVEKAKASYDADAELVKMKIAETEYTCSIPRAEAEVMYAADSLQLETGYRETEARRGSYYLVNPLDRKSYQFEAGLEYKVNAKDGLRYVSIEPGSFLMGCSAGDTECSPDEKPAHEVKLTRGFWLGESEVTQSAYQKVVGKNPSNFKGEELPVENVTWNDAAGYCAKIGGRLPTEAEWEYSARAGTTGARYGEVSAVAWFSENSKSTTHPVKQKEANRWGLYDMLGNVYEWTADWYQVTYDGTVAMDPKGPTSGYVKALRGGSWGDVPRLARASFRNRVEPTSHDGNIGFRCVWE